jgi:hypothetical protein
MEMWKSEEFVTDAWQASNTVTGYWIKEKVFSQWEYKSALLGFTRLNNAHNGQCLGGALFKVLDHLDITLRLGHVTCDNASNNHSMLEEFS